MDTCAHRGGREELSPPSPSKSFPSHNCEGTYKIVTAIFAEERIAMSEVGVTMRPWEYRMRFYGEDEDVAKEHAQGLGADRFASPSAC